MHRARHGERARGIHTLSKCTMLPKSPCINHHGSSPNPILLGFLWWLHYIVIIDLIHWPLVIELNLQPLLPPQWSGDGAGSSNPFITWLASPAGNTFLGTLGKTPYLHNKRHLDCSHHSGNYKGFQNSIPEMGMKTKYIFLIINNSCTLFSSCTASSPQVALVSSIFRTLLFSELSPALLKRYLSLFFCKDDTLFVPSVRRGQ